MIQIAPSILSADFANLEADMRASFEGGAGFFHIDVMDGHFVENITIGPPVLACLKGKFPVPLDVHLMIEQPRKYFSAFAEAGADYLIVHAETCPHLHGDLQEIRRLGCKPGVVINPGTPLSAIEEVLGMVDLVLLMSVNPGFGGQAFIPETLPKIRKLREMIDQRGSSCLIEVDGGVKLSNAREVAEAGADILVAGSAVFGGSPKDPKGKTAGLKEAVKGIRG